MNKKNQIFFHSFQCLILLILIGSLSSCIPQDSARLNSGGINSDSTDLPTGFTDTDTNSDNGGIGSNAILQDGQSQTTNTLDLQQSTDGNFIIKSANINSIITNSPSTQYCLAVRFAEKPSEIYLARAQNFLFNDFSSSGAQRLNTWLITPNDTLSNQTQCSGGTIETSLENNLNITGGITNKVYNLENACPNCSSRTSQTLIMISQSGEIQSSVFINQKVRILSSTISNPNLQCSNGAGCTDGKCCVEAQCVSNGQVRPGTDENSQLFQVTLQNILNGNDSFSNHQDMFFVCANGQSQGDDTGNTDGQTDTSAQTVIEQIGEYLACQQGEIDEQGICAIRYENASNLINPQNESPPPAQGYSFSARADDLNFSKVNLNIDANENKIVEIRYAGRVLFKENDIALDVEDGNFETPANIVDDITQGQNVIIRAQKPDNALNDTLIIKYKTDVSCISQGNSFTKCRKFFNIGQLSDPPRPSDHVINSNQFLLPEYANVSTLRNAIILTVDGNIIPRGSQTWDWSGANPRLIIFQQNLLAAQKVVVEYFVQSQFNNEVGLSARIAKEQIAGYCGESPTAEITLVPETAQQNGATVITGYRCQTVAQDTIPAQQSITMSSNHAPHLFYSDAGSRIPEEDITSDMIQELEKFEYTGSNPLQPNNDTYIGFNEIYGSFNTNGALPAKEVRVKKGKLYNIRTDVASYTPCPNCGNDYYAPFLRMFPSNTTNKGGGIEPDNYSANRSNARVRSDDFLFGRACFVPATMIPWSHNPAGSVTDQRRARLKTQHALFSNGYQRDWFGFDYGSLIGSFDGLTWFSIGNLRQITAKSSTLYLAINGYFSDLALANNMTISVSEVLFSTNEEIPDHDSETDGAQCQRAHYCEVDNDCIAQLGYDYVCSAVDNIKTPWPALNINSREVVGEEITRLTTLFGGANGQSKRCVYRGRGALCSTQDIFNSSSSYAGLSNRPELHKCSPNSHCSQVDSSNFNYRISRYARGPQAQNSQSSIPTDSDIIGLAARILGRPYDYQGQSSLIPEAQSQLISNQATAICIPGRAATSVGGTSFSELNNTTPQASQNAKILNTGVTPNSSIGFSPSYLSACPVTDEIGNLYSHQNKSLDDTDVIRASIKQNLSSNLLLHPDFGGVDIFNDSQINQPIENIGLKKNSCLRAPGATCFSDLECAPNNLVASQTSSLSASSLNIAEFSFWQEGLICSQKTPGRDLSQNPQEDHILKQNRCCRETGKQITIYSTRSGSNALFNNSADQVASIHTPLNNNKRYSRLQTIYDDVATATTAQPSKTLLKPNHSSSMPISLFLKSYEDFHNIASRTCCSQSWVRNFHSENGGGHTWSPQRMQTIDKSILKSISWSGSFVDGNGDGINDGPALEVTCNEDNYQTVDCGAVSLSDTQIEDASNYFATLELVGIPQVAITPFRPFINEENKTVAPSQFFIEKTIINTTPIQTPQFSNGKFSAQWQEGEVSNFTGVSEIKPVFSEHEFSCCKAALEPDTSGGQNCCSGASAPLAPGSQVQFCCMPDYTNVSAYLNRYVSSEAADMDESLFDPETGYLKDPETALQRATNICCSGKAELGRAADSYRVPGLDPSLNDSLAVRRRFLYRNNDQPSLSSGAGQIPRSQEYDNGRRWNTQIYCVPQ